jgi:excisionase family DNA binding protein
MDRTGKKRPPSAALSRPVPRRSSRPPPIDGPGGAPPVPVLLPAAQVARIFGRSQRTIRNWIRAGHLHSVRVGRAVFFRADDIHALLDAG